VAVALIEAKAEHLLPGHGLEQAKVYAATCRRLNVLLAFSSNGHQYVEFNCKTGITTEPRPLSEFPTPADLRDRYEQTMGFSLESAAARPLLARYPGGEATRRYYQDAAIRAVLEKLARGEKRALLALATGSGKTFIAVHLLKKIADAGQLRRALFVCDRDELRSQGLGAFQNAFGADAAPVSSGNPQKNTRILIATYQTRDVASEDGDANFLTTNYPENYFSHIIIDECHRSAWGRWSQVLTRNAAAVQIGLTATPRQIEFTEATLEVRADAQISADNLKYFGEPVYEYDIGQGIEDGYLAACEIVRRDLFLGDKSRPERETGLEQSDLQDKALRDANTGEALGWTTARARYAATDFEERLLLPDRVREMCRDLFSHLLATGGPEQKSIIFCARDRHADDVTVAMNNLYATWCAEQGKPRLDPYAFKCTAAGGGADYLADLRGALRHHFVATTVDLLTTGVDVPCVRNIVFFKYVRSPIAFYQMIGRGTRLDPASEKLMFRVYDYTDATRLFGEEFKTKFRPPRLRPRGEIPEPSEPPKRTLQVEGFEVRVTDAGRYSVISEDGRAMPVTVEEYKQRLAAKLVEAAPTLDEFRQQWIVPSARRELLTRLPEGGRSALLIRALERMDAYDLYDVLGELGYGLAPRTRPDRADAFTYKHAGWLSGLPTLTAATLKALAGQFAYAGTESLENPQVFQMSEVVRAGGLDALKILGEPGEILHETKGRLFAA
jgi:type I restriction enzyme R subunit